MPGRQREVSRLLDRRDSGQNRRRPQHRIHGTPTRSARRRSAEQMISHSADQPGLADRRAKDFAIERDRRLGDHGGRLLVGDGARQHLGVGPYIERDVGRGDGLSPADDLADAPVIGRTDIAAEQVAERLKLRLGEGRLVGLGSPQETASTTRRSSASLAASWTSARANCGQFGNGDSSGRGGPQTSMQRNTQRLTRIQWQISSHRGSNSSRWRTHSSASGSLESKAATTAAKAPLSWASLPMASASAASWLTLFCCKFTMVMADASLDEQRRLCGNEDVFRSAPDILIIWARTAPDSWSGRVLHNQLYFGSDNDHTLKYDIFLAFRQLNLTLPGAVLCSRTAVMKAAVALRDLEQYFSKSRT